MMESGWLDRQLSKAAEDVKEWPAWLKEEAGLQRKRPEAGETNSRGLRDLTEVRLSDMSGREESTREGLGE